LIVVVMGRAPYTGRKLVSTAEEIHRRVPVADGHSDSLMWNRDLTVASEEGDVDFPRLKEAGVKLQCFTVVTRGLPVIGGFPLFIARQKWPVQARRSEWSRCTWQLDRMADFCRRSSGSASIAGTRSELDANLQADRLSAVLGVEGAHAIEGQVDRVQELWQRGVRFIGLAHLSNNELCGSSTPLMGNKPVTPLGHQVLEQMEALGMALDVAHASPRALEEMFARKNLRPFSSHTGAKGATNHWRNLSDEALKTIADRGGVVGIIFSRYFVGGSNFDDIARHIEHAINVMGEEGVGLGSDFDGFIPLPQGMRDVRDLPKLTDALLKRGFPEARVEKVLGRNLTRFFQELLGAAKGLPESRQTG
jgi:membrane dipeptidase